MRRLLLSMAFACGAVAAAWAFGGSACTAAGQTMTPHGTAATAAAEAGGWVHFSWVTYTGSDPDEPPASSNEYRNPIISGFQPDPSILRAGNDYYLINSSFAFFPGIPVFHSRDLVNWEQLGNAIDRPTQLNFSGLGIARAVFAPTIRRHGDVFYIIGTCVDCGSNFVITAKNPAGPWSDPVWLKPVDGVDPDLFIDGPRAWIVNNGPPSATPAYPGHRAIWIQEFDLGKLKMRGARSIIVDGGVDFAAHPIWIEGPHLLKKDGWYYLIAAEGGTEAGHSEVVFRSRSVTGPYTPGPENPILTQRDLDPARAHPVAAAGHADFVQTPDGSWWAVFLATRPYEGNLSNMGRETFLLPVDWVDGWPKILAPKTPVPRVHARPRLPQSAAVDRSHWRDSFDTHRLAPDWEMIRMPAESWYRFAVNGGLEIQARQASISGDGNPSFLGKRQRHENAAMETEIPFPSLAMGERAGVAAFADERHHYFFGLARTVDGTELVVALRDGAGDPEDGRIIASAPVAGAPIESIRLRMSAHGAKYDFHYAIAGGAWRALFVNADGKMLASEPTNQFTGTLMGLYARLGGPSDSLRTRVKSSSSCLNCSSRPSRRALIFFRSRSTAERAMSEIG
jgi:xylan 1,4-beta-xylosidase